MPDADRHLKDMTEKMGHGYFRVMCGLDSVISCEGNINVCAITVIKGGGTKIKLFCQVCSAVEEAIWGANTAEMSDNDDQAVHSNGIRKSSLRVLNAAILNGQTRDAALESLAATNPNSNQCVAKSTYDTYARKIWKYAQAVGQESVKRARYAFIKEGDGDVAIDGG